MLTSISPLGERARGNSFWRTATAYAAGSLLGGSAVGAALGAVGAPLVDAAGRGPMLAALAALMVAGLVLDHTDRLPTIRRQVNERWLSSYRGWVYGFGFGAQLGAGVVTIVTASTTYVALAAAFLSGSPAGGLVIGAIFGGARALPLLVTAGVDSPADLAALHRRVAGAAGRVATGTRVAQATLAVSALVMLGST